MKKAIINSRIFTGYSVIQDAVLIIEDGKILSIQKQVPKDCEIINLNGMNISAGLIDIQINGGYQHYFSKSPDETTLLDIQAACADFGTTFFLPTLISSTHETIIEAINAIKNFQLKYPRSGVLGMHLEGPFFNIRKRGAHNPDIVRMPTDEELASIVHHGKGIIKVMTIAPELFRYDQIRFLQDNGIILSAGHSDMRYDQAQVCFAQGIQLATHLYNAMSPFQHRSAGLVGAIFDDEQIFCSIILDGYHCEYAAARIAYRLKKDKLFLITDSTFLGRKVQSFKWGGLDAEMIDGTYRNQEGNLAGAAISMVEAVKNAKDQLELSLATAIEMATLRVAKAIHMEDQIGCIAEGYPATFFVFNNELNHYHHLQL